MSDDFITIETPEHIQVHYELAGIGSRALAGLVDTLLQLLATAVVVLGLTWLGYRLHWMDAYGLAAALVIGGAGFLVATAYFVICEMTMDGQSPGKRMAGLRVVRDDGTPLTFLDSTIRNVVRAVDMIPFFYTVALLAAFFSKRSKRLGDMAAGTVVVKERLLSQPQGPAGELAPELPAETLGPEAGARLANSLHLLTPADFEAVERFLARRYELDPTTRERFASHLSATLLARMPLVPPDDFPRPDTLFESLTRLRRERPL